MLCLSLREDKWLTGVVSATGAVVRIKVVRGKVGQAGRPRWQVVIDDPDRAVEFARKSPWVPDDATNR